MAMARDLVEALLLSVVSHGARVAAIDLDERGAVVAVSVSHLDPLRKVLTLDAAESAMNALLVEVGSGLYGQLDSRIGYQVFDRGVSVISTVQQMTSDGEADPDIRAAVLAASCSVHATLERTRRVLMRGLRPPTALGCPLAEVQ
jgi:hypothetical protein